LVGNSRRGWMRPGDDRQGCEARRRSPMTDEDLDACLLGLQRPPMNASVIDRRTYRDDEEGLKAGSKPA
jgi:hypothetical protein